MTTQAVYTTPGVYYERTDTADLAIRPLRTDITGFVGVAPRGPLDQPQRLESMTRFRTLFGETAGYPLGDAVAGFFANGGRICWVTRAGRRQDARRARLDLRDLDGRAVLRLWALGPGEMGNVLKVRVLRGSGTRFTLIITAETGIREVFRDLTMAPPDHPRFAAAFLGEGDDGSQLVEAESLLDKDEPAPILEENAPLPLTGGAEDLECLSPLDLTGEGTGGETARGLEALAAVDEVSLVAMPDIVAQPVRVVGYRPQRRPPCTELEAPPANRLPLTGLTPSRPPVFEATEIIGLQQAMIAHCERQRDRVALLDPPRPAMEAQEMLAWARGFSNSYAALYHPWLRIPARASRITDPVFREVPPCGYMAGLIARVDLTKGVFKPPANEELEGVIAPARVIDDREHGLLNDNFINVIRAFPGRGIRPFGARTPAEDTRYRFLNVRRLVIMIVESVEEQTRWTVFEPNDPELWISVDRAVRAFLHALWRRGGLGGATEEEAYFVRCDESTNPPEEIDAGRVTCLFGFQPPKPAEFIIIRIGRTETGLILTENPGGNHA